MKVTKHHGIKLLVVDLRLIEKTEVRQIITSPTRYDKIPSNLLSPLALETPPGVTAAARFVYAKMGPTKSATHNMALLSRYLHHRRWIWAVQPPNAPAVSLSAVSRILSTLTRLLSCLCQRSFLIGLTVQGLFWNFFL